MKTGIFHALVLIAFALCSFNVNAEIKLHGKHAQMHMQCDTCHGDTRPREVPDEQVCLNCHGSREDVKKLTSKLNPNPHYGHSDSQPCNDCHKQHEPSVLTCDQCHKFGYKTP